ncbi:YceI family protein [Marinoscillum luteum]|uniref:YceI family protein n=1 Tax=Marinoscillum luteum TaxID=861051 RepID=A0ABW7N9F7_9BACT
MLQSIVLSLAMLVSSGEGTEANYKVDTKASTVEWLGKKVTGQHNGLVNLKEGSFEFKDGVLTGGTFTVDMTTIVDSDMTGEYKDKLEGHLKSDDFFGVAKYPTSVFTITKAVPQGPGKYKVVGNITIKGKTEEIQFPATLEEKDGKVTGTASLTIDRSKFDVRYGSGSFFDDLGDKTIYDDFELTVNIVASK